MRKLVSPKAAAFICTFLICEGVLLGFYYAHKDLHEVLAFGATIIAAAFALFQFMKRSQHDRFESAARFIERWNDPKLNETRLEVRAILTDALLLGPLIMTSTRPDQFSPEQNEKREQVIGSLNFFEEMAIAVQKNRADERYLYDYFSVTVREVWNKLYEWVQADRRFGDPEYWCEFENLARRWAKGIPWWV